MNRVCSYRTLAVGALCLLVLVGMGSRSALYLGFYSYPEHQLIHWEKVEQGQQFSTLITHSVHLTPVYETYRVAGKENMVLESTHLQDLGWGVPSTIEHKYKHVHDFMVIEGIERSMPSLPFRVSALNDAQLLLGKLPENPKDFQGKKIMLEDYVADGERITFTIISMSLLRRCYHRISLF